MIIRKTITTILAPIISIFVLFVIFEEGWTLDLIGTALFTIVIISPIILLYGVPITFISDLITKRFSGIKRFLFALVFHLFFGVIFPYIFCLFEDMSSYEIKTMFVAATTFAFFFWLIDEISRNILSKSVVMKYEEPSPMKFRHWLMSFAILLIVILSSFTIHSVMESMAISSHSGSSMNWDAVILFNIIYSFIIALLFTPIGYLVIKTIAFKRASK